MTNDESIMIAETKVQYEFIAKSLEELKILVSLKPNTPLRDSVSLLVTEQIKEQHKSCCHGMTSVAENAVSNHVGTYHSKRRDSVAPSKQAVISDVAKERAKFWGVVTALLGLVAERFLNQ